MKLKLTILAVLLFSLNCFSQGEMQMNMFIEKGTTLGSVIAVVTSWDRNKSVLWAILHAFFSWFYVVYYIITRE